MGKTKSPRKKYQPPNTGGITYSEEAFLYSTEDSVLLTNNIYLRLLSFVNGTANYSDRTTLKIRLLVGLELLKGFTGEGAEELLTNALTIIEHCRDKENRSIRLFTKEEYDIVKEAITLVHQLSDQSTLWMEASAYKKAEDLCIVGADKYEYVFIKEVE